MSDRLPNRGLRAITQFPRLISLLPLIQSHAKHCIAICQQLCVLPHFSKTVAGVRSWWDSGPGPRRTAARACCSLREFERLETRSLLSATWGFATAVQPDDSKLVIVGSAENPTTGSTDFLITRLNPDGTLDTTFDTDGHVLIPFDFIASGEGTDIATCVALQSDGKILVGGSIEMSEDGDHDMAVVRLNFDGSPDLSFGIGGKAIFGFDLGGDFDDQVTGIGIAPDGKIIVGGYAQVSDSGNYDFAVARLSSQGFLDTSFSQDGLKTVAFNLGGDLDDRANALAVQADGRIFLAGSAQRSRSGDFDFAVAKIDTRGNMDSSFNKSGKKTISFNLGGDRQDLATSVAIQGNTVILAGSARVDSNGNTDFAVARLKKNGSPDKSFNRSGKRTIGFNLGGHNEDRALTMLAQSNGRLILAGSAQLTDSDNYDFALIRITINGSIDPTFGSEGFRRIPIDSISDGRDQVQAIAVDPNADSFLVVGNTTTSDEGDNEIVVARLTTLGNLDAQFGEAGLMSFGIDL